MEWVETTAKTLDAAREAALDQLGVAADEAEFDVIEEPRPGLFGRVRGEARLRARVRPAQVRPKQERRRRGRSEGGTASSVTEGSTLASTSASTNNGADPADSQDDAAADTPTAGNSTSQRARRRTTTNKRNEEPTMTNDERPESTVTPDEVGTAAVAFMEGLTTAFGADATVAVEVDGIELDVTVTGSELGLLVGPGGRTLNAVQDLARVAAQRRLGDHETRLRVDVAGYRERREAALGSFARDVAEQVVSSGTARSLEPMTSADRKVIHDVLNEIEGVTTRSVGEDPDRRIIVDPA
ncbi:MAG TPA: RNA-binding cell elongation regulator Jag/EloR [Ilumatobacteraceae bacterium]|nr:RNA-binding cell elongation regulator Jag/EloR [Ilumatobacteraceae bacterium]